MDEDYYLLNDHIVVDNREDNHDDIDDYYDMDSQDVSHFYDQNGPLMAYRRAESHNIKQEVENLASNCVITVFQQSFKEIRYLLLICLIFRLFSCVIVDYFFPNNFALNVKHFLSCFFGLCILHHLFNDIFLHLLGFFCLFSISAYACSNILYFNKNSGLISSLGTIFLVLITEMIYSEPTVWNRVRGVLLLLSMKIISVLIDCDRNGRDTFPNILEYCGYCLHPGTVAFGPWISFQEYRMSLTANYSLSLNWTFHCIKSIVQSYICLLLSDCICSYLFINEGNVFLPAILPVVANQWMLSYESAISFHFSHYYISYVAVATCLLSGIGATTKQVKKSSTDDTATEFGTELGSQEIIWSEFKIAKPLSVEIPQSMLNVVVAWNIPMSKWLKLYVFDSFRYLGNFAAILFTYAASAMLHGLSFHLASILLSLGFYTYVEYSLRKKLSHIFNSPSIQARPKGNDNMSNVTVWTWLFNFSWIIINLMHLAYLGSMFEDENNESGSGGYSLNYTLTKWGQLGYVSHIFAITCFVINWLI